MAEYKFFAKVYDRMMDNIPYEEWEQYLLCLLYRYGVPPCSNMTELGCGTGVMTRLLAADGFAMTGIDLSEEMLHVARKKRYSSFDEHITYINSDMRDFHVNEKQDAIVSVCDSMNYLLTNEDLYKTMVSVRKSLKENGVFIFDLKTEYFFKTVLDGRIYREDMGDFSYIWKNRYDGEKHIHEYRLLFTHEENKEPVREKEVHRQRVFTAADIKEAAIRAGFTHAAAYDAFTYDKPRKCSERIYIVMKR